ncbi:MAG: HAD family hydrolase [Haloarculaceae archaeon]
MTTAICFSIEALLVREATTAGCLRTAFEAECGRFEPAWAARYEQRLAAHREAFDDGPRERSLADVCEEYGIDVDPAALADRLATVTRAATDVRDGAGDCLDRLGADNRLGVIAAGTRERTVGDLGAAEIRGLFDAVVTTYEAGAARAEAAVYELARERLDADEYAMVGPDYERDVEAARTAGFVPIHYEPDASPSLWETLDALV